MGKNVISGYGIAHDAANTTSIYAVKVGGVAFAHDGTDPGDVDDGDFGHLKTDLQGALYVNIGNPYFWHTSAAYTATQANAEVATAPGAGLMRYITDIAFGSDTSGTWSIVNTTGTPVTIFRGYILANEMRTVHFRQPIKTTAENVNVGITTNMTNSSLTIQGYIAP